jgi:hypothetical protein
MPVHTFLHNFLNVLVQIANKMRLQKKKKNVRLRHDFRTRHLCVYFGAVYIPEEGLKALLTQLRYLATVPCTGNWHKQQITTVCGLPVVKMFRGGRGVKLSPVRKTMRLAIVIMMYTALPLPRAVLCLTATCVTTLSPAYWRASRQYREGTR